jgi:hypothetical protein
MSEIPAAVGFDRLPWLADDEPRAVRPRRRQRRVRGRRLGQWVGWAVAALLMIAGAAYWLGIRTAGDVAANSDSERLAAPVTVPLPPPRAAPEFQAPQVVIEPAPQVEPVAAPPPVKIQSAPKSRPVTVRRARPRASTASKASKPAKAARASPARAAPPAVLWPVRVEAGASGRMVRIGAFATRLQAKRGWSRIMRFYPGMKRLPTLVVAQPSLRNRRTYYRLQMGTTSQAHSEVLCQRMRTIAQSCVVVDLPAGASRR